MGVYIIISPSISHTKEGVSISLQLKDKMVLLNGECGGVIPALTTLSKYDTIGKDGERIISYPTIYQILL
jgi:hypothetical protein